MTSSVAEFLPGALGGSDRVNCNTIRDSASSAVLEEFSSPRARGKVDFALRNQLAPIRLRVNSRRAPSVFTAALVGTGPSRRNLIAIVQIGLRTPAPGSTFAAHERSSAENRPEPGSRPFAIALRYNASSWSRRDRQRGEF
jgi:hypothetical protein